MNPIEKEHHEADRRNVTVVFADVTGFTELSEKIDPETLRDLMNKFFQTIGNVVTKYEGTIDKFIGDAVMVLFGAPIAHENDPERAIRSALEMRSVLNEFNKENEIPLSISIGINSGWVVAGAVGTDTKMDFM